MHLPRGKFSYGPASSYVTPIAGNTGAGGAVGRRGISGPPQALYAVMAADGSGIKCYTTTGGYLTLSQTDSSVTYLSTILAPHAGGQMIAPAAVSLQYIGSTLYAHLFCKEYGSGTTYMYARIMRDTSPNQDGSGPWVLHGSMITDGLSSTAIGSGHWSDGRIGGGDIAIIGNTWAVVHPIWYGPFGFGYDYSYSRIGISYSTDAGVTWTNAVNYGFYLFSGSFNWGASRSWVKGNDGRWYVGMVGSTSTDMQASADLITWSDLGANGVAVERMLTPYISDPTDLYFGTDGSGISNQKGAPTPNIYTGSVAVETATGVGRISNLQAGEGDSPHITDIGPGADPTIVALGNGRVLDLGGWRKTGWVLGAVS